MTVIDYEGLIKAASGDKDLSHDFSALYSIKKNVSLPLKSPRAIVMIDNKAYIVGSFSDSLYAISVTALSPSRGTLYSLGESKPIMESAWENITSVMPITVFRNGSPALLSPFGRPDALNWMLANEQTRQRNAKACFIHGGHLLLTGMVGEIMPVALRLGAHGYLFRTYDCTYRRYCSPDGYFSDENETGYESISG